MRDGGFCATAAYPPCQLVTFGIKDRLRAGPRRGGSQGLDHDSDRKAPALAHHLGCQRERGAISARLDLLNHVSDATVDPVAGFTVTRKASYGSTCRMLIGLRRSD